MDELPFNKNLNYVGAAAAVAIIVGYFFPDVPENVRMAFLTLAGFLAVGAIMFIHTFINHPENQNKAEDMARKAVRRAKGLAPMMALIFVSVLSLSACANWGDNPENDLDVAKQGFTAAQILYNTVCIANGQASFCSPANMQLANDLATAAKNAIDKARIVIRNSNSSDAQIAAAIDGVRQAIDDFTKVVNDLQASKAKAMQLKAMQVSMLLGHRPVPRLAWRF